MNFRVLLRLIGAGCLWAISGLCIAQAGANNGIPVASMAGEPEPILAGTATISGQVRLPSGTLQAGIKVSVAWQVDGEWQEAIGDTQADGSYSVDGLTPASYRVCAGGIGSGALRQCFDHIDHVSPNGEPAFSAVTLSEGEQRSGIDFDLGNGGSISGQLIDAHASAPLADYSAIMYIHDSNGELLGASRFTTSASGHYRINGLPDGALYLVVSSLANPFVDRSQIYPGIPCDWFDYDPLLGQPVTIAASGNVDHIDFSFHPDAIVRGKVVDAETGAGLDGVTVTGYLSSLMPGAYARFWSTISHGPDGAYELYLLGYGLTGSYYIVAENAAPHASTAYPGVTCIPILSCLGSAVPLSVQPASTFNNIDISLPLGSAISGAVTDALSGAPLSAYVEILDETDDRIWWGYTAEDGSYSSDAVPAGTYYAIARSSGSPPGCLVYDNRPCPADGMPLASVDPTPLVLKLGEIRNGTNFPIDTNTIFSDSFEP